LSTAKDGLDTRRSGVVEQGATSLPTREMFACEKVLEVIVGYRRRQREGPLFPKSKPIGLEAASPLIILLPFQFDGEET
jgi:hypothetical protein